ncbi:MAG: hypothetical protein L6367_04190 [Cellulomonas sp.]|nr:hypothetical protein [Cellulomonas sp.]
MTLHALGTLTAAAPDGRTLSYRLLPFGETGRTSAGAVTVDAGALTVPDGQMVANLEHDPTRPVGWMTAAEDTSGLTATVTLAQTTTASDVLAEARAGLRTGISVEVLDPVIRDGRLLAGRLTGAGLVAAPAFPSAQLRAADAGDLPNPTDPTEADPAEDEAAAAAVQEDDAMGATTTEAAAEATETEPTEPLTAALPGSLNGKTKTKPTARAASLFAALAGTDADGRRRLTAALDQAIATDLLPTQAQQWLGEVYASRTYVRRYAPLIQHLDLAALKAIGWKFTSGKTPTVGDYAGFPAQPTSTEVKTESVTLDASRIAGAGAVDRAFIDFPVPEFWAGYYRECTNDYERKLDAKVPALLAGAATATVADTVPSGVSTAASYIVDGAAALIDGEKGMPTFAIVGTGLWKGLLRTRSDDTLAYLTAALGLEKGSLEGFAIIPSSLAAFTGKVLVGVNTAATLYELPGASPVRVDTVNISTGGVETGVFGYWAGLVNDAASLSLVAAA